MSIIDVMIFFSFFFAFQFDIEYCASNKIDSIKSMHRWSEYMKEKECVTSLMFAIT